MKEVLPVFRPMLPTKERKRREQGRGEMDRSAQHRCTGVFVQPMNVSRGLMVTELNCGVFIPAMRYVPGSQLACCLGTKLFRGKTGSGQGPGVFSGVALVKSLGCSESQHPHLFGAGYCTHLLSFNEKTRGTKPDSASDTV